MIFGFSCVSWKHENVRILPFLPVKEFVLFVIVVVVFWCYERCLITKNAVITAYDVITVCYIIWSNVHTSGVSTFLTLIFDIALFFRRKGAKNDDKSNLKRI